MAIRKRKAKRKAKPAKGPKKGGGGSPQPTPRTRAGARDPAAEWVDLEALKGWEGNPRKNAKAISAVKKSIKRFGFGAPVLARRADGEIIAGHTRVAAAKSLKLEQVPVRFLDLDPNDARLLALADNRLGELADWDEEALAAVLKELDVDDVETAGWDQDDLDKLMASVGADGSGAAAPELLDAAYSVIVDCEGEDHQAKMLERFEAEGLPCRPLMT